MLRYIYFIKLIFNLTVQFLDLVIDIYLLYYINIIFF